MICSFDNSTRSYLCILKNSILEYGPRSSAVFQRAPPSVVLQTNSFMTTRTANIIIKDPLFEEKIDAIVVVVKKALKGASRRDRSHFRITVDVKRGNRQEKRYTRARFRLAIAKLIYGIFTYSKNCWIMGDHSLKLRHNYSKNQHL